MTLFNPISFGLQVRVRCAEMNISRRTGAKQANVSAATFCRVASGRPPDVETYLRLVSWLEQTHTAQGEVDAANATIARLSELLRRTQGHLPIPDGPWPTWLEDLDADIDAALARQALKTEERG